MIPLDKGETKKIAFQETLWDSRTMIGQWTEKRERRKKSKGTEERGGRPEVRNSEENLNEFSEECHTVKIET